jgi:hypothetical protein
MKIEIKDMSVVNGRVSLKMIIDDRSVAAAVVRVIGEMKPPVTPSLRRNGSHHHRCLERLASMTAATNFMNPCFRKTVITQALKAETFSRQRASEVLKRLRGDGIIVDSRTSDADCYVITAKMHEAMSRYN